MCVQRCFCIRNEAWRILGCVAVKNNTNFVGDARERRKDERIERWMGGWMDEGWMGRWMNEGWMGGWMNEGWML